MTDVDRVDLCDGVGPHEPTYRKVQFVKRHAMCQKRRRVNCFRVW